jgi:hypothetical protein
MGAKRGWGFHFQGIKADFGVREVPAAKVLIADLAKLSELAKTLLSLHKLDGA